MGCLWPDGWQPTWAPAEPTQAEIDAALIDRLLRETVPTPAPSQRALSRLTRFLRRIFDAR